MHFIQLAVEGMFFGVWKLFPFISDMQVSNDNGELKTDLTLILDHIVKTMTLQLKSNNAQMYLFANPEFCIDTD